MMTLELKKLEIFDAAKSNDGVKLIHLLVNYGSSLCTNTEQDGLTSALETVIYSEFL